jgi:hypothetical protein
MSGALAEEGAEGAEGEIELVTEDKTTSATAETMGLLDEEDAVASGLVADGSGFATVSTGAVTGVPALEPDPRPVADWKAEVVLGTDPKGETDVEAEPDPAAELPEPEADTASTGRKNSATRRCLGGCSLVTSVEMSM